MKVGSNIKEIREFEKNLKREYVAKTLNITTRAYANIENDITDITLGRLDEIANILGCTPLYILTYKQNKKEFYNTIHNNDGNQGVIKINQSSQKGFYDIVYELQQELIRSQKERISLLETILRENRIEF